MNIHENARLTFTRRLELVRMIAIKGLPRPKPLSPPA